MFPILYDIVRVKYTILDKILIQLYLKKKLIKGRVFNYLSGFDQIFFWGERGSKMSEWVGGVQILMFVDFVPNQCIFRFQYNSN